MKTIVLGGGIVGLACAHYLTEGGHEVTLLEADRVAAGCSSGNLGYVCPSHLLPLATPEALRDGIKSLFDRRAPFRIRPQADVMFLRWLWRFVRAANETRMLESAAHLRALLASSRSEYARLVGEGVLDCQWRGRGMLYLFRDREALAQHGEQEAAMSQHFGTRYEHVEADALSQLEPGLKDGLAGGFLYPDDACLRPEQLARSLVQSIRARGGTIIEQCRVEDIDVEGGQVRGITTASGRVQADHYVLATGVFSGRIGRGLGLDLPVVPGKGYSLTLERFEGMPSRPLLFPQEHVGVTPFDDGFRIGSMMEFVGFDPSVPEARIAQLRAAASHYLEAPLPQGDNGGWCGWRPMTPDSLPIIGSAPGIDNLMLATGHNMLGVTLAPATGRLVADLIGGATPGIDPAPYRASRW